MKHALACIKRDHLVLKSKLREVLLALYKGKNWFPTGYDKILCYQLLPLMYDFKCGKVVVISPLVSLIVDQLASLLSRGVLAAILPGNTGVDKKVLATEREIETGHYTFLYSCPVELRGESNSSDVIVCTSGKYDIVHTAVIVM